MISEQVLAEADRMTEMKEYAMREIYNHATSGYKNPIDMVVKTVYSEIGECVIAQRMLSHYVMSTIMMKRMW